MYLQKRLEILRTNKAIQLHAPYSNLTPPAGSSLRSCRYPSTRASSRLSTGILRRSRYTEPLLGSKPGCWRACASHPFRAQRTMPRDGRNAIQDPLDPPHGSAGLGSQAFLAASLFGPFKINITTFGINLEIHGIYCRATFAKIVVSRHEFPPIGS
jgi:hypothetical protein